MYKKLLFLATLLSVTCFSQDFDSMLQTKNRDIEFKVFTEYLELQSESVSLDYKMGYSNIGLKILKGEDYVAYWLPDLNIDERTEGQVVSYYLGRFLNMSKLVAPSNYFNISGKSLTDFEALLVADTFTDSQTNPSDHGYDRRLGKIHLLKILRRQISGQGSYWGALVKRKKKFYIDNVVDWENNKSKENHVLFRFIRANQPMPSSTKIISLSEFYPEDDQVNTTTEIQLSKDLSKIMVLDMLMGQFDRFSGGNLEAYFDKDKERLRLYARDNNASSMVRGDVGNANFITYLKIVTRFDKKQVKRLEFLLEQLELQPDYIKETLRMISPTGLLKKRVQAVLGHIQNQVDTYGEERAFFN